MKKLSESLQELADRVGKLEKKAAAAEKQNEEKVEAAIDASKADAKARQDEFKAKVSEGKEAVASQWEDLQTNYNQQVAQIKSNIEAKKESFQLEGIAPSNEPMMRRSLRPSRLTLRSWQLMMLRSLSLRRLRRAPMQTR